MTRPVLSNDRIHPAIQQSIADNNADIIAEVEETVNRVDVVVVGMGQNPFPKKARKALHEAGIDHEYLEYGNYMKLWRRRNTLKMWTGWPTFPMVFHKGVLIGGFSELQALLADGTISQG